MKIERKRIRSLYTRRWNKYAKRYLECHPLCVHCLKKPIPLEVAATVVDHIRPHKGDFDLFWEHSNHQPLCKRCHDVKTATFDGGFGRATKKVN